MDYALHLLEQYKYVALFPLAAFEGPLFAILVGVIISQGLLLFWPSYIILLFGDIIPDSAYYFIGRFGSRKNLMEKYGSKSKLLTNNVDILRKLWNEHGKKTMFFSKLAYGLSTPFLISAGLVELPFAKFLMYAVPVTIIQYGVFTGIGYALGGSYTVAEKYMHYGSVALVIIGLIFVGAYILFFRYAKKQILKLEKTEE